MNDAVDTYTWINLVRRARLGKVYKAIALTLATYADPDGSRVYPGVARLSYESEHSYSVVKKALAALRTGGLIRKVGRRGDADEYRLIFSTELLEHIEVPTPAQEELALAEIRRKVKGSYTRKTPSLRTDTQAAETVTTPDLQLSQEDRRPSDDTSVCGLPDGPQPEPADQNEPVCGSPKEAATNHDPDTTTTLHSDEELRTTVTVSRATPPTGNRCPHGRNRRRCTDCRAKPGVTTPPAASSQQPPPTVIGLAKCPRHGLPNRAPAGEPPTCSICRHDPLPAFQPPDYTTIDERTAA